MEEEVSELLGSLDLGRHVEKIQNYDIQYTTITDKVHEFHKKNLLPDVKRGDKN